MRIPQELRTSHKNLPNSQRLRPSCDFIVIGSSFHSSGFITSYEMANRVYLFILFLGNPSVPVFDLELRLVFRVSVSDLLPFVHVDFFCPGSLVPQTPA